MSIKLNFRPKFTKPVIWIFILSVLLILFKYACLHGWIKLELEIGSFGYIIFVDLLPFFGELAFTGAILTFLLNNDEVIDSYKRELTDLLYGSNRFLDIRKDIDFIWQNASKAMIKQRFPKISDELTTIIKEYFPLDDVNYYKDYTINKKIKWINESAGIINIEEDTHVVVIADNTDEFKFNQTTSIEIRDNDHINNFINLVDNSVEVNGELYPCKVTTKKERNKISLTYEITLRGSESYVLKKKITKQYNINVDNKMTFSAKHITNEMTLSIEKPTNFVIEFVDCSRNKYQVLANSINSCVFQNKGLILPKQGYTIILSKKTD